jgi:hypothetical protein
MTEHKKLICLTPFGSQRLDELTVLHALSNSATIEKLIHAQFDPAEVVRKIMEERPKVGRRRK